jgi:3-hydroxybutyryl-CoA dehydrogenase
MQWAAVIGGGLMGHGIAQVLALGGLDVVVHDPAPAALEAVPRQIAEDLEALGITARPHIGLEPELEVAARGADWVFEAAPEDLPLKQEIFERLDKASPTAVLATNTSVMRVGDVASRARAKRRILGAHWWNPPFLVSLVEVVQGPETDPTVIERMMSLLDSLGKTPVHVRRDVAGFVGNRLQHAPWREAFDLVGLDLTLAIHKYVLPDFDPPSQPSAGLRRRVARGELGMKTGSGFRSLSEDQATAVRERVLARLAAANQAENGVTA